MSDALDLNLYRMRAELQECEKDATTGKTAGIKGIEDDLTTRQLGDQKIR
jgi:hypothetical protein